MKRRKWMATYIGLLSAAAVAILLVCAAVIVYGDEASGGAAGNSKPLSASPAGASSQPGAKSATSASPTTAPSAPNSSTKPALASVDTKPAAPKKDEVSQASILAVGDVMFHLPQVMSAKQPDGTFDFKPWFSKVKDLITSHDLAIANLETTIHPGKPVSGYPSFNTPVEALDALKDAGFDVMINDNNHTLDTGLEGLRKTLALLREYGFASVGSGEPSEDKSAVIEKNGIKIGILSYSYGTNVGKKYPDMVNYIDEAKMNKEMKAIRPKVDYLIVYFHVGTEYVRTVEPEQQKIVNQAVKFGADAVLCSHPHVTRKTEVRTVYGRSVLINYSMGNFISNQNNKYTDIGSIQQLTIEKRNGKTRLIAAQTQPVYRLRYKSGKRTVYHTIPSDSAETYKTVLSPATLGYIAKAADETAFSYQDASVVPVSGGVSK